MIKRIALVLGGLFILFGNSSGGADGTLLGFYLPNTPQRIGFDLAKGAIAAVALYAIYRGIRPKPPNLSQ